MARNAPVLRPIIGVERLAANPGRVLIVHGPETAAAVQKLIPKRVVLTWMAGVATTDWGPLAGREVDLWMDAGAPGRRYAAQIAERILPLGCKVRIVDDKGLELAFGAHDAVRLKWGVKEIREFLAPRYVEVTTPPAVPPGPVEVVPDGPNPPASAPKPRGRPPKAPDETKLEFWQRHGIELNGGKPHSNAANAYKALVGLNRDRRLGICYDEFAKQMRWGDPLRPIDDNDIVLLQCDIQDACGLPNTRLQDVRNAVMRVAREHVVNEARDWLTGLRWDGTERLPTLMADGFGAQHSAYTAAVGRCFMMSMAARMQTPGCQQDYVLVLEGAQGERKTTALQIIGGPWFTEIHEEFGSLEFLIAIQGKVLVEIGELSAFKGARLERVKGIITRRIDTFRSKYGIWANDHLRVACFAGTTNESNYLNDPTGGRRYWPVAAPGINLDYLRENRDQLWAEAVARLERGELYWDVPAGDAEAAQEERREIIPWEEKVISWLETQARQEVSMSDVLAMLCVAARDETNASKVLAPILRRAGWKRVQKWVGRARVWVYRQSIDERNAGGLNLRPAGSGTDSA